MLGKDVRRSRGGWERVAERKWGGGMRTKGILATVSTAARLICGLHVNKGQDPGLRAPPKEGMLWLK